MLIYYYRNGVYLQECFATYILRVKIVHGGVPKCSRLIYYGPHVLILNVDFVQNMPPMLHFFGFCWKVKILSVQCMAGFGSFKPEALH